MKKLIYLLIILITVSSCVHRTIIISPAPVKVKGKGKYMNSHNPHHPRTTNPGHTKHHNKGHHGKKKKKKH